MALRFPIPAFLAGCFGFLALLSCGRDFENPYDPDSKGYAGAAWAQDRNGDGISDSVAKYAPGCSKEPAECLRLAQAAAKAGRPDTAPGPRPRIPVLSVEAEDMILAPGQEGVPRITVRPADATDPRFEILTHDPRIAYPKEGRLVAASPGTTLVTVRTLDGGRQDLMSVTVEPLPSRVQAVSAEDMDFTFFTGLEPKQREPVLTWSPFDAADKGFTLASLDPTVARIRGGMVEAIAVGEAQVVVTAHDGGKQATFRVRVKSLLGCGLLVPCPVEPGKGKGKGKEKDGEGG
jgi:hypothetical protein